MTIDSSSDNIMITPLHARHILYLFGRTEPGVTCEPGGFVRALLDAIVRADTLNLDLLMSAYPAYVAAYRMAAFRSDGIDRLSQIARSA